MIRRIVIEIDAEDSPTTLVNDITNIVMGHIDGNVEFKISQEILTEKEPGEIQIPGFLCCRKMETEEDVYGKDVAENG